TAGVLVLNNFGTLATSAITIDQGGTLTLDNTTINIPNSGTSFGRFTNGTVADKPNLTFNSGTLNFLANNTAAVASSDTVGSITLASGQSTISSGFSLPVQTGVTSRLTAASLSRNAGATVNFVGSGANLGTAA